MQTTLLIDWVILGFAVYFAIGVTFKPKVFWESKGMLRRRELIGDRNTVIMYLVIAILMAWVSLPTVFASF